MNTNDTNANNVVEISGTMVGEFTYDYTAYAEDYYLGYVFVPRLRNGSDVIPIIVPHKDINTGESYDGRSVKVSGSYNSFNKRELVNDNCKSQLKLYVKSKVVAFDTCLETADINNSILLNGFICKKPVYRRTPLGRTLTEVFLAVNMKFGKTVYIPCIAWGANAEKASCYKVGDKLIIEGRIQSRSYLKRFEDVTEERVAYEVSIFSMEKIEQEEMNETE